MPPASVATTRCQYWVGGAPFTETSFTEIPFTETPFTETPFTGTLFTETPPEGTWDQAARKEVISYRDLSSGQNGCQTPLKTLPSRN